MSKMINRGRELLRICSKQPHKIEYSNNSGRTWHRRSSSLSYGSFWEIMDNGMEILATTSQGLYYSINDGRSWHRRSK